MANKMKHSKLKLEVRGGISSRKLWFDFTQMKLCTIIQKDEWSRKYQLKKVKYSTHNMKWNWTCYYLNQFVLSFTNVLGYYFPNLKISF